MIQSASDTYLCPGERHGVSRAVHLARLAAGYDACCECPLRGETAGLPRRQVERLEQIRATKRPVDLFHPEGAGGRYLNVLDAAAVRRLAMAHAKLLRSNTAAAADDYCVVVGHDGRSETAELAVAARDGLRFFGCPPHDRGATTTADVARRIAADGAAGGMFVGNDSAETGRIAIRFLGPHGQPFSAGDGSTGRQLFGGSLDQIVQAFDLPPSRPVRSAPGQLNESSPPAEAIVSNPGGRTLRFVLDTSNRFLRRSIPVASGGHHALIQPAEERVAHRMGAAQGPLAAAVIRQHADFGIWIDGHGERCRVVDERGAEVAAELLTALLAVEHAGRARRPVIVLEPATAKPVAALLKQVAKVRRGHPRCEAMFGRMAETEATFGGGPSGRIWFGGPTPTSDAAQALRLLLEILQAAREPISSLLDRLEQQTYDRSEAAQRAFSGQRSAITNKQSNIPHAPLLARKAFPGVR